jgi:putative oxidoreductase
VTSSSLDSRLNSFSSPVISLFRAVIGFLFALHGAMTLFNWPLAIPMQVQVGAWPVWWSGVIEFITGLLVMVGLFTRPAAFLASGTMAVAYFWQHQPKALWPFDSQIGGNNGELSILFCFSFFLLVFIGPGNFAIDSLVRRKR